MKSKIDYTLYLCTDRELMSTNTLEEAVELAIKGGCTIVQLREKDCTSQEFYKIALSIREITSKYKVPLIINDRVDIAMSVEADGVHVGQSDLPASVVRKMIGENKILGVSASNLQQSIKAIKDGADYIGVGAMNNTTTKKDAKSVTIEELKKIRSLVSIPIVVIGGINKKNVKEFKGYGIDGLAVVSAVITQKDISAATRELVELFKN